jgi:hypothetical protein
MSLFILLFFLILSTTSSFDIFHLNFLHHPHFINDMSIAKETIPIVKHHINNVQEVTKIINEINNPILLNMKRNLIYEIVKTSSKILPNFDSIGHHVLHWNGVFINKVLDSNTLELSEKKKLILSIINMTQKGDETGSFVLQSFYDFVDKIMN